MANTIVTRNLFLAHIAEGQSLGADFKSDIIDFKEMNTAFIQIVQKTAPTLFTGKFSLVVSLLCDESTFVPYPDSERELNADCNNFGWNFCCVPFRYARVCYTANTTANGIIDIWARAKRT